MENEDERMCMMRGCTEADLLAAKCRDCGRIFCSNHILRKDHQCDRHLTPPPHSSDQQHRSPSSGPSNSDGSSVVECPLCMQHIHVPFGSSADRLVAAHIDAKCPPVRFPTPPAPAASHATTTLSPSQRPQEILHFCDFQQCRRNEATLILCPYCRGNYCVDHRHTQAHACRSAPPPPRIVAAAKATTTTSPSQPKKLGSVAKPLSLTPGKEPDGSVPSKLVQIAVAAGLALDRRAAVCVLRVSGSVPAGRLLDAVCAHTDITNPNGSSLTRPEDKLCFRKGEDGSGSGVVAPSATVESLVVVTAASASGPIALKLRLDVVGGGAEERRAEATGSGSGGGGGGGQTNGTSSTAPTQQQDCLVS